MWFVALPGFAEGTGGPSKLTPHTTQQPPHQTFETKVTLEEALALSDIVIAGVPSPKYSLPLATLKAGVIAINFSTFKNFDEAGIQAKASIYVGSVGKVTVSMLSRNLLRLHGYQTGVLGGAGAGADA